MTTYKQCVIKSFKHNGHLHRMWLENWFVPFELLHPAHAKEKMYVMINQQTPIHEADGKVWMSKVPAVSFFIPGQWFNVVALLEESGVRYYCNVASPPYLADDLLTYIDYDLDVIRTAEGGIYVVDRDEYEVHKAMYHYTSLVEDKVKDGLRQLMDRVQRGKPPFDEEIIHRYYKDWKKTMNGV